MSAKVAMRWNRPDGKLSHLRGNAQVLPDSNVFVGWSGEDGYMTEHSSTGEVLMEARFSTDRLSTYRAYKYHNFIGTPAGPPSLKAFTFRGPEATTMTSFYVSWNGATEVARWKFYGSKINKSSEFTLVGSMKKSGFETVYASEGDMEYVFAEAVAADGASMRNSTVQRTNRPQGREVFKTEATTGLHQIQSDWSGMTGEFKLAKPIGLVLLGFALSVLMKSTCHRRHRRLSIACK